MDELMNFTDSLYGNEVLRPLLDLVENIMNLPDNLNEAQLSAINNAITNVFNEDLKKQTLDGVVKSLREVNMKVSEARATKEFFLSELNKFVEELKPSAEKKQIIEKIFDNINGVIIGALDVYIDGAAITLPFKLDEGAKVPTYAHASDACADIYAAETVTLAPRSFGNMIHTGLHIALSEGWQARIAPRSSIGAKTPLRMSNSMGIIDSKRI